MTTRRAAARRVRDVPHGAPCSCRALPARSPRSPCIRRSAPSRARSTRSTRRRAGARIGGSCLSWPKKTGKTETIAALAAWACTSDLANGGDREVYLVGDRLRAGDRRLQRAPTRQFERNPQLGEAHRGSRRARSSIAKSSPIRETGGKYNQCHVIRAVPRDVRGLHGVEPVLPHHRRGLDDGRLRRRSRRSRNRRRGESPIARLRRVCRPAQPGQARQSRSGISGRPSIAGSDPGLFASILTGPDAWKQVPLLSQRGWTTCARSSRRVRSKFERLVLNQWAQSEHALDHDARTAGRAH